MTYLICMDTYIAFINTDIITLPWSARAIFTVDSYAKWSELVLDFSRCVFRCRKYVPGSDCVAHKHKFIILIRVNEVVSVKLYKIMLHVSAILQIKVKSQPSIDSRHLEAAVLPKRFRVSDNSTHAPSISSALYITHLERPLRGIGNAVAHLCQLSSNGLLIAASHVLSNQLHCIGVLFVFIIKRRQLVLVY